MGADIQSLKFFFLLCTTGVTIYTFIRDVHKGLQIYLIFLCACGFLGFARPIYAETIILPFVIAFGKTTVHSTRVSYHWLFLLALTCLITIISGNDIWGTYEEAVIVGLVMLAFSHKLFPNDKQSITILMLLWCYSFCRVLWLLRVGGSEIMAVADIADESTRLMAVDTGLKDNAIVDPNYFGYVTGMGAVISFLYYRFKHEFNQIIDVRFLRHRYVSIAILAIGCLEVFFTLKGLSRGMLLALLAAVITYVFLQRKYSHLMITVLIILVASLIISRTDLFGLYIERFASGDEGAGRLPIWMAIWDMMKESGPLFVLFGGGLNFPWWESWHITVGLNFFSTHNSWVTILLSCGLMGGAMFFVTFFRSYYNGLQNLNSINQTKLVLLSYVIVATSSIEPLAQVLGWIPLVLTCTILNKK